MCAVYLAAGSYTQAGGELAPQSLAHYLRVARRCRSVSGYPLACMGSTLLQRLASSPTRRGKNVCAVYLAAGSYTQAGGELAPQSLAHYLIVARRCRFVSD